MIFFFIILSLIILSGLRADAARLAFFSPLIRRGGPLIRITQADFLIPPELQPWALAASTAGRVGGARLELLAGPRGTNLGRCYQQVPLRVLPPFSFGPTSPALLYLLSPTAGLLDGDAQLVELTAGPGSRALVVGQSATRIHPACVGLATQQWSVRVGAGAVLAVLPGPAIPFAGCRYYQRVRIDLDDGAGLVWGDAWLAGRYARGEQSERFRFDLLSQDLTVRRAGRTVYRDRFVWRGPWDRETADWHFGEANACASLFVTGAVPEAALPVEGAVARAVSPTAAGDTCLRWVGTSEAVIGAVVASALRLAARLAGQQGNEGWLPPHELAPCHWFSPAGVLQKI